MQVGQDQRHPAPRRRSAATRTGLPVVFANSLGTDLRVWDPLLPHLPAGLRIVRYDMRGHGLSDAPEGDYWMGDLVADAAGADGRARAQRRGLRRPLDRRRRRAGPRRRAAGPRARRGALQHRGQDRHRGDAGATASPPCAPAASRRSPTGCWRTGSPGRFHAERADELALWRHMLTRTPVDGYCGCCAALARHRPARVRPPACACRSLAIAGADDGSTPPDLVRETAESIAGARFEIIRGAGHIPCVEQPEALARLIAGFLKEHGLV